MIKNITKYLLILTSFILLFFLIYISFNAEFRRTTLTYVFGGYKTYKIISIKSSMQKNLINLIIFLFIRLNIIIIIINIFNHI